MENTIFFSTRHTFRLFILFLCFISISLHGMFTAPRRTPVRKPITLPSAIQQLEPEKSKERAQALEQFKQEQLEAQRLEQEQLKKERLEAEEKQKALLQSNYPAMGFTIKGGMPALEQKRIQEVKKKHYSLSQLIKEFNYLHSSNFPQNVQNIFKDKIIAVTAPMSSIEIIKNKRAILTLDPDLPEFKSLIAVAKTSITIADDKGNLVVLPENFWKMSNTFSSMIGDLGGVIPEEPILVPYPFSIIQNIRDIIEQELSIDYLTKIYPLNKLITITNCLDYLDFPQKIQKPFRDKIYLLCKKIPEQDLSKYSLNTARQIFIDPVTQSLKNSIIKRFIGNPTIKDPDRKTMLQLPGGLLLHPNTVIFSPNQKMIAVGAGIYYRSAGENSFLLYKISEDGGIDKEQKPQRIDAIQKPVTHFAFSPDSKSIIVGCFVALDEYIRSEGNNLFLLKIDDQGIVNKNPQILKGHSNRIDAIAYHPSGKSMISVSHEGKVIVLLRTIDSNGTAGEPSNLKVGTMDRVEGTYFSPDGTMLVGMRGNKIIIWQFKQDGTLEKEIPTIHTIPYVNLISTISWMPDSKSCIIGGLSKDKTKTGGLILCNMPHANKTDLNCEIIEGFNENCYSSSASPDGKMIIADDYAAISLFTIQDDGSIALNCKIKAIGKSLSFSPDSNQIMFLYRDATNRFIPIYTLFTQQDKKILKELERLDGFQLILIGKILGGAKDISIEKINKYKIPENIIELLKKLDLIPLTPNPQL